MRIVEELENGRIVNVHVDATEPVLTVRHLVLLVAMAGLSSRRNATLVTSVGKPAKA